MILIKTMKEMIFFERSHYYFYCEMSPQLNNLASSKTFTSSCLKWSIKLLLCCYYSGQTVVTFSVSIKLRLVSLLKKAETFEMSQTLAIFERGSFYSYELFSQLSIKNSHLTARASKVSTSVTRISTFTTNVFSSTTPLALLSKN